MLWSIICWVFSWLLWPFKSKPYKYINTMARNRGGPYRTRPATDLTRWRLKCEEGRQTWHYIPDGEKVDRPQTALERHLLGLDTSTDYPKLCKPTNAKEAVQNGVKFYTSLQTEDGHWAGDYGGPLFLMPGLVIVAYITNSSFTPAQTKEMIRYIRSVQTPDGGWGLHTEGPPTVFGTAMNYITLRLLGVAAEDPDLVKARTLLHKLGGALSIPSWGKFWLSVLNVYSWDGVHNIFPEMWILPEWVPMHPSKIWCHCRQVYLPMSYCYGYRVTANETQLIKDLRKELYVQPYELIDWKNQRNNVAPSDLYTPHSKFLDLAYYFLDLYEPYHIKKYRKKALETIYKHICADDQFSKCISIGPVSKSIQMLVRWHHEGAECPQFKDHQERVKDYLWMGVDGMKMNGTNGSQLWDTVLVVQALLECGLAEQKDYQKCLNHAHEFLMRTQVAENPPDYHPYYRQMNRGGFSFSTRDCGWVVADCTAEGLKTVMYLQESCDFLKQEVSLDRQYQAIDVILGMKNINGAFATYENIRGGKVLELLNPSEVFGDIMIDYPYIECTSAVIQALKHFSEKQPKYRCWEVQYFTNAGLDFIEKQQRPDGSWYGSWGVCFTYGAWFGLEAYAALGFNYDWGNAPKTVDKACQWLVNHRLPDGGWGENFESCEQKKYIPAEKSQVVNTAWALLGLMAVRYQDMSVIEKGIKLLMDRQLGNGDFPQENITGVFNKSCAIHYDNYRNIFPLWALGRFVRIYPDHPLANKV